MNDTRADKYDEKLILSNIVIDQNKQILLCSLSMISWKQKWGVCWWVVRVDTESFAPHWFGFKFHQGLRILSCEEPIQLTYKTSVVLLRGPFVPEIMHPERHQRSSCTSKVGKLPYWCDVKVNFFSWGN